VAVGGPALIAVAAFAGRLVRTGAVYLALAIVLGVLAIPFAAEAYRTLIPSPPPPPAPTMPRAQRWRQPLPGRLIACGRANPACVGGGDTARTVPATSNQDDPLCAFCVFVLEGRDRPLLHETEHVVV
jgi:hypothetical protein